MPVAEWALQLPASDPPGFLSPSECGPISFTPPTGLTAAKGSSCPSPARCTSPGSQMPLPLPLCLANCVQSPNLSLGITTHLSCPPCLEHPSPIRGLTESQVTACPTAFSPSGLEAAGRQGEVHYLHHIDILLPSSVPVIWWTGCVLGVSE